MMEDLRVIIKRSKWEWTGHLAVREDDRWSKIITEWCPIVMKRKRGRQNTRWRDDIAEMTGKDWCRVARQRKAWQFLGEAYAHKGLVSR